MTYTNVAQMTEQVNHLQELIQEAKNLANVLRFENGCNFENFRYHPVATMGMEARPLDLQERKREAAKYQEMFRNIEELMGIAERTISMNY